MHFNLNIHGKNPETFTTPGPPPYDLDTYGNSIFIPEYTAPYQPVTIESVSNKNGGTEFAVTDPYAMPSKYENGDPTGFAYADDLARLSTCRQSDEIPCGFHFVGYRKSLLSLILSLPHRV